MDLKSRLRDLYGGTPAASDLRKRLEKLHRGEVLSVAEFLEGCWKETVTGRLVRVEKRVPYFHSQGRYSFEELMCLAASSVALLAGDVRLAEFEPEKALFLDTETTGLAGGAGTCPFLVGAGYLQGSDFHLIQFFLPDFQSEHCFLLDFVEFVNGLKSDQGFKYLVTFNGKSFDLSLLENRFVLQRLENPCTDLIHLDLLHPCRLLWKGQFEDCTLQTLERNVLGYDRFPDIASALIPSIYFNYLHWGEFGLLGEVLHHNVKDIVSMAILLGVAGNCLVEERSTGERIDNAALARFHLRRGRLSDAALFLEKSLSGVALPHRRAESILQLIRLKRSLGENDQALDLCYDLIRQHPDPPVEAFEQAAKILEHRKKALADALDVVFQGLHCYPGFPPLEQRRQRLERRSRRTRG